MAASLYQSLRRSVVWTYPWIGWAYVYTFVLLGFFVYRCKTLRALFTMYATPEDGTAGIVLKALSLGFLEDFVCVTYFALALWLCDTLKQAIGGIPCTNASEQQRPRLKAVSNIALFLITWFLYVAMMAPFVADLLLVRLRSMRFTFELIAVAIEEKDFVSAAPISSEEIHEGCANAAALVFVSTLFSAVRTWAPWADLTPWNPALEVANLVHSRIRAIRHSRKPNKSGAKVSDGNAMKLSTFVDIEIDDEGLDNSETSTADHVNSTDQDTEGLLSGSSCSADLKTVYERAGVLAAVVLMALVVVPAIVVALSCASSPLVAYSALNATLNELFAHALEPAMDDGIPTVGDDGASWVETFIHGATEKHTLFGPDSLYRRTTGFKGDLAFDVNVDPKNPPNVLVIAVESFRHHDSRYLVGDEDPSNLFKGSNLTITPNFDRWAKRGVAFSNMWSSWQTSRSIESLLFAQLPYDSVSRSGMSGGKEDVALAGLPQLFTAKGYETFFMTGCLTSYDSWDVFLPAHGFDTVWNNRIVAKMAEGDLGIKREQWYGPERRGFNWGVHDDVSFQVLANLLVNKTSEQRERVKRGEAKKPLFLTHYTISSHGPFESRPTWYAEADKPDFSAMYDGEEYADLIKNYMEMRSFTDVALGKFLDRMAEEGVLNDTIVVIVGDHGQAPEVGTDLIDAREVSVTRVPGVIIAEGRLGNSSGLVVSDAVEQYDMLNTLADITGVPSGGFLQGGVGRSLKRKVKFGERVVFSNNPRRKMSIVRGHQRLRYDRATDSVLLHDADTDHDMTTDLFPGLTAEERAEWRTWRNYGRHINTYYTKRWDGQCLLAAEC